MCFPTLKPRKTTPRLPSCAMHQRQLSWWERIEKLYKSIHELWLQLAPELTERHTNQSYNMKVTCTMEMLKASVCMQIMALVYATSFMQMRWWQPLCVIKRISSSPMKTAQKCQRTIQTGSFELVHFLNHQIPWIQSWKSHANDSHKTLLGGKWWCGSILHCQDISANYNFLTRRLQQYTSPLESVFGRKIGSKQILMF